MPRGFYRCAEGYLECDGVRIAGIADEVGYTPFYLTSRAQLQANFEAWEAALQGLDGAFIGYAIKANHNLSVLRTLAGMGCGCVLVSGNELKIAQSAGFSAAKTIFNGNGKCAWEIELAIQLGVLINIDSLFDLDHLIAAALATGKTARALLRINPNIEADVHAYVSTGTDASKFGLTADQVEVCLRTLKAHAASVQLVGVHCHTGSTIKDASVFRRMGLR
jgi:diaminopimelate decarboxylase